MKSNPTATTLSAPAVKTSTVTGTGIDISRFNQDLIIVQDVGVVSGTSPTLDGKIQTATTQGGTYADVSGATFTQATASNDIQAITVPANSCSRWIRYVGTIAGTSPSFAMGVACVADPQNR